MVKNIFQISLSLGNFLPNNINAGQSIKEAKATLRKTIVKEGSSFALKAMKKKEPPQIMESPVNIVHSNHVIE